jgi:hypothetical protein
VLAVDKFPRYAFVHFSTRAAAEVAFEKGKGFIAQGIVHFEILWYDLTTPLLCSLSLNEFLNSVKGQIVKTKMGPDVPADCPVAWTKMCNSFILNVDEHFR